MKGKKLKYIQTFKLLHFKIQKKLISVFVDIKSLFENFCNNFLLIFIARLLVVFSRTVISKKIVEKVLYLKTISAQ